MAQSLDSVTVVDELRRTGKLGPAGGQSACRTLSLTASAVTSAPAHAPVISNRHADAKPTTQAQHHRLCDERFRTRST